MISFLARFLFILFSPAEPYIDFEQYYNLAIRIVQGDGFSTAVGPTAFRAPAYPFMLALVFNLTGISLFAAKFVNVLLGTLSVLGGFLVGKEVFNKRIGLVTAVLIAFTPSLILYTPILAAENLATPLLLFSLWLAIVGLEKRRVGWSFLGGLCVALGCLTKPDFLLLPGVLFLYFVLLKIQPVYLFRYTALFMLGFIIGLAPWTIRNYAVLGEFIPLSTNGGLNLAIGLHDGATGTYTWDVTDTTIGRVFNWDIFRLVESDMTEYELDRTMRQAAIDFVKREPVRSVALALPKLWYLYHEDVSGIYHNTAAPTNATPAWIWTLFRWLAQIYYMVMLGAAVYSLKYFTNLKHHPHTLLIALVIVYWTAVYLIFFGMGRFHLPVLPLIYLFSSYLMYDRQKMKGGWRI